MKYVWHHWEKKSLIVSTIWWKLCRLFVFLKKSWQIEYFIAKKELGSCHESKWASQDASNLDLKGNSGRWECNKNQSNILTAAEFSQPPLRLKTILIEAYNEMQVQNWKRSKSRNLPKFSISRHLLISKKVSRLESIVFERKYGNWFLNHQWLFFCGNISDLLTYFSFEISCLAQKQKPNPWLLLLLDSASFNLHHHRCHQYHHRCHHQH